MSEKDEGNQLDKFAASSMRGPKRGIYQQLLAQLLIKANRANDSLIKISCICEAALMSRKKKKLDMKLVHVCYMVCQSFKSSEIRNISYSFLHRKEMIDVTRMAWVFPQTEENYRKYIESWQHIQLSYYAYYTQWRYKKYPIADRRGGFISDYNYPEYYNKTAAFIEDLKEKTQKDLEELPEWQNFYETTSAVAKRSFFVLQGEFTGWALPKLLETQATLSDEIDPEIWKETLSAVSKDEQKEDIQ